MKIIPWKELFSSDYSDFFNKGSAVTIGCFDGPHKGHQVLFDSVIKQGTKKNLLKGVITFTKSIAAFKHKENYAGNISTLAQRLNFFEAYGFDFVLLIDFSSDFSKIEGTDFFEILSRYCKIKYVAEGIDFKCGNKGSCTAKEIDLISKRIGFEVQFMNLVTASGERVSSSQIRALLSHGIFFEAAELKGSDFELDLSDLTYEKSGSALVFQRSAIEQVLPENGMYDVFVNTSRKLRSRLEVSSKTILVELPFNENPPILSIIFINKE